jgi:hypothetical protein
MSLLNKNLKANTRVKIVMEDHSEEAQMLHDKTGTVVGFERKQGSFGVDHYYIVLLDSLPIGTQWSAHTIKESFLKKL